MFFLQRLSPFCRCFGWCLLKNSIWIVSVAHFELKNVRLLFSYCSNWRFWRCCFTFRNYTGPISPLTTKVWSAFAEGHADWRFNHCVAWRFCVCGFHGAFFSQWLITRLPYIKPKVTCCDGLQPKCPEFSLLNYETQIWILEVHLQPTHRCIARVFAICSYSQLAHISMFNVCSIFI